MALTVILLSFSLEIVALLMPIASQVVVDEVVVSSDYDLLLVVAAGLVLLLLLQLFLEIARGWTLAVVSTTVNLHWNSSLFEHMIRLPLEYFAKRHVGDINSRFGSLAIVQKALTTDLILSLFDGVMAIGMLIMLFLMAAGLDVLRLSPQALTSYFVSFPIAPIGRALNNQSFTMLDNRHISSKRCAALRVSSYSVCTNGAEPHRSIILWNPSTLNFA